MTKQEVLWVGVLVVGLLATVSGVSRAQDTYRWGQPVSPAYEGWEQDPDGSLYFLFGYMNVNWDDEPDIPVGPDNYFVNRSQGLREDRDPEAFNPVGADRGQPTHFLPRRNRFVFRIPVPDDFDEGDEVVWTLTTHGETIRAYATLLDDYLIEPLTKASEMGALGAGSSNPTIRANKAPELRVEGERTRTVSVGQPLSLAAVATDDDVPESRRMRLGERINAGPHEPGFDNPLWQKPRQATVGSETGLRFSWYVYRGEGEVSFNPTQVKVWEDTRAHTNSPWQPFWVTPPPPDGNRWETSVTFKQTGTYVLRALASDGALSTDSDVTVTVTGADLTTGQ